MKQQMIYLLSDNVSGQANVAPGCLSIAPGHLTLNQRAPSRLPSVKVVSNAHISIVLLCSMYMYMTSFSEVMLCPGRSMCMLRIPLLSHQYFALGQSLGDTEMWKCSFNIFVIFH